MRTFLGLRALLLLAPAVVVMATPVLVAAQSPSAPKSGPPETETSFTSDMRLLDGSLLRIIRERLERSGHSFYSIALYVADTAGPAIVYEYGMETEPLLNDPRGIADALRSTVRKRQSSPPAARTVGIIVDSIAGPLSKAVDGSYGPPFPRFAITELEDRKGRCRRVEREYRFVKGPPDNDRDASSEFGHIVFGDARVAQCRPRRYWPVEPVVETPSS